MTFFAVEYTYGATLEQLAELRPVHREFISKLYEEGVVLASGPIGNYDGALILVKAANVESVAHLFDNDPFDIAGFITDRVIREWTPVFGPFGDKA